MDGIPTVRSFCGFVDLKIACIAIASLRMAVCTVALLALTVQYVSEEDAVSRIGTTIEKVEDKVDVSDDIKAATEAQIGNMKFLLAVQCLIAGAFLITNILATYWYIKGALSNDPTRMKWYLYLEIIGMFLLVPFFLLLSFIVVPIEFYFFMCSNSLYQECRLGYRNEVAVATTENTTIKFDNVPSSSAKYNSCEQETEDTPPNNANTNPFSGY